MNRKIFFTLIAVFTVCGLSAMAQASGAPVGGDSFNPSLLGLAVIGGLSTVTDDKSGPMGSPELLRQEFHRQLRLAYYLGRNGVISTTVATLPGITIATNAAKIKTANATVLKNAGVANALGATDDAWTLTGAAIVNASGAAQFVRYLLLASAADALTVVRSSVAASAAACAFDTLPADGLAIVGIATIEIANGTTFTPGTTELSAAGITDTYRDGDQDDAVYALGGRIILN